jgi:GntR family transcriptional regulator, transcriptional repressor for pyruvate dehydrogenase complex
MVVAHDDPADRAQAASSSAEDVRRPFEPVSIHTPRAARVYDVIVQHVERLVEDGSLKPGDRLPSEREMARRFHVGRSSVQDAIRVLDARGIVKLRQGGTTVVRDPSDSLVGLLAEVLIRKRTLVEELMDVREIIEPALAARAAEHATEADIKYLNGILLRQAEKVRRGESAVEEDFEFHNTIARVAGNSVVLAVLDTLINLLAETRRIAFQVKGRAEASLRGHRRVLRAIQRRSPKAAESGMRAHVRSVESIILKKRS